MRVISLLTAVLFALVLGGCGKTQEKAGEKKVEKKVEKKEAAAPEKAAEEEKAPAGEAEEQAGEAAEAAEEKVEEAVEKVEEAAEKVEEGVDEAAKKVEEKVEEAAEKVEEKKVEEKKAPAGQEDLQARRERIQEIYKLGRSGNADDLKKLEAIITDADAKAFEKATAIRALGNTKQEALLPALKDLAKSNDLAVKSEAAILLYQWGEKDEAKPLLEELLNQGVALRRAFFKGIEDGKYVYEPEAEEFFQKAMDAKQVHVKLDAALGLLHLGDKEVALKAFEDALADQDKEYVRLTAVSYLASARDVPEARALLEKATKDESARVSNRAKQILGTNVPQPKPQPKPEAKPEENK